MGLSSNKSSILHWDFPSTKTHHKWGNKLTIYIGVAPIYGTQARLERFALVETATVGRAALEPGRSDVAVG